MRTQDRIYSILKNNLKAYDLNKFEEFQKLIKEKMAITTQKRYYISDYGFENTKDYIFGKTDKLIKKPNYDNYSFENLLKVKLAYHTFHYCLLNFFLRVQETKIRYDHFKIRN